jgi:hypothetical protein
MFISHFYTWCGMVIMLQDNHQPQKRKVPQMPALTASKKTRARKSYEDRTGMGKRSNIIMVKAIFTKPETTEDSEGNVLRTWKSSEMSSYSNADIASCLVNRVAVEANEMLGTVPPSAIKYCVTKGWLIPNAGKTLYLITLKGAIDLDLPMKFRGKLNGRKIPFAGTKG